MRVAIAAYSLIMLVISISGGMAADDACGGMPDAAAQSFAKLPVDLKSIFQTTSFLPAGASADIVVPTNFHSDADTNVVYRAIIRAGAPSQLEDANKLPLAAEMPTTAKQVPANNSLVTSGTVPATSTIVNLRVPEGFAGPWGEATVYLFGCKPGAQKPTFKASTTMPVSSRWISNAIVWSVALVLYCLVAWGVARMASKNEYRHPAYNNARWGRYLDPVLLSAGPDGRGSLSKLQILFFAIIVFGLVTHILLREGVLSDVSQTVLILIGIAGVGSAAAKATDTTRRRIDFDNWAWFVRKGWLTKGGLAAGTQARWRDIVTSDGEFDVYRFQSVVFSLVVGAALIGVGLSDLSSFSIPENLLAVLGLSQVVYIGGKLVAPPSFDELNKATKAVIEAEKKLPAGQPTPEFENQVEALRITFESATGLTIPPEHDVGRVEDPVRFRYPVESRRWA